MRIRALLPVLLLAVAPTSAQSQAHSHSTHRSAAADSAFAALQKRGAGVMGVDQYTSVHRFETLPDGGRIELQRDSGDTVGVRTIREHLRTIAQAFADGDFSASATVHAQAVPGTDVMRSRGKAIRYEFRSLAGGGEVRITTSDAAALRAVHEFLAFQRSDHRVH